MRFYFRFRQIALILGDLIVLYASLILALLVRYGNPFPHLDNHFWPFTANFLFYLIAFYVIGLYEIQTLKNTEEFLQKFQNALLTAIIIGILFFYVLPTGITPKITLSLFFIVFGFLMYGWRLLYNIYVSSGLPAKKILLVGYNLAAEELTKHLTLNPQLGYEIKFWMKEGLQDKQFRYLSEIIAKYRIEVILIPAHIKKSTRAARLIYKNLLWGIEVTDLSDLYETVFKKVPLSELEEVWFLENLAKSHRFYEAVRRPVEIASAAFIVIITLPLFLLSALIIILTSRGPAIFSQKRVGRRGQKFTIYKFRSMRADAEKDGPRWSSLKDSRVTGFGRFLRRTHLDELPQLLNVLRGEISLIGPRPERPEFVETLEKEIPFYELRHLIRPGLTGWAQVNYRYGASVNDAYEKLQYDIYYLKNRSLALDLLIILKTIRFLFSNLK